MQYLIKDLSRMTGIKGFTIRKWQERYKFFQPTLASNGYWYYSNDDYVVLSRIVRLLSEGMRISKIASIGRDKILQLRNDRDYSEDERTFVNWMSAQNFTALKSYLDERRSREKFTVFINLTVKNLVVLCGRAWEDGLLTTADEHSFSRWIFGYLRGVVSWMENSAKPVWLVAVFPGDRHEIGALMYYALLRYKKIAAKFVGILPIEHVIRELNRSNQYKAVSFSMTLAQTPVKIEKLKGRIQSRTSIKKVMIGGRGYSLTKHGALKY